MDQTYQHFLKLNIDTASLGMIPDTDEITYFCTPIGASIIGSAGVDGIHFCFIQGFGNIIFAVSPDNLYPEFVHPLAENFADFLRLLLACGNTAALEQTWMWDQAEFDHFLRENPITTEQREALDNISENLNLSAMEQPWQYIKNLQSAFDYSKIPYSKEFYDLTAETSAEPEAPEWKVYFDGTFWGHDGKDHAGTEVSIGKQFEWANRHWLIPAIYLCGKGLVIDFCMQVEAAQIQAFLDKWDLIAKIESHVSFSKEQREQIAADNPLGFSFTLQITLNGQTIPAAHGCIVSYTPSKCIPNDLEAKWSVDHYALDPTYGWMICRWAFPWKTRRRPKIKMLSVTLSQELVPIFGPHFHASSAGDTFDFIHPTTGQKHTLTVHKCEQETISLNGFLPNHLEFPTHFVAMQYTIVPELAEDAYAIHDCAENDPSREKQSVQTSHMTSDNAASVGMISSADGPMSIFVSDDEQGRYRTARSSLYFTPRNDVEWYIVYHEKQFDDITVEMI